MLSLGKELAHERIDVGNCQLDTLRLRFLEVGAMVRQSARRILVRMPLAFLLADAFVAISARLTATVDAS